jgi:hypothetical protein
VKNQQQDIFNGIYCISNKCEYLLI